MRRRKEVGRRRTVVGEGGGLNELSAPEGLSSLEFPEKATSGHISLPHSPLNRYQDVG